MTNAIIDNSSLTSVERVLGFVLVNQYYDLSGDLSAYENYLTALLFYDRPSRIDDYIPKHREGRTSNFPELGAIHFESDSYDMLLDQAKYLTERIYLKIKGGNLEADPISDFLKSMDLHVCPAWIMQSIDYYLRIRLLAEQSDVNIEKYSVLMGAIFEQLGENSKTKHRPNWLRRLIGSDGREIKDEISEGKGGSRKIAGDIKAFSAGLNWMALRSVFYSIVSQHLEAVSICHPIRSDFIAQYFLRELGAAPADQRGAVAKYFSKNALDLVGQSSEMFGDGVFKLKMPLISAWSTMKAGSPLKGRALVLEARDSPEARALRARMRDIEDISKEGDSARARAQSKKLFRDFSLSTQSLFQKYGKSGEDYFGISANVFSMSGSFKVKALKDKVASLLPSRSMSVAILRNITQDIIQSPTLGRVSDMLRSNIVVNSDNYEEIYRPKVDSPRFRYTRAYWKEPM